MRSVLSYALLLLLAAFPPAFAHHSFASQFDPREESLVTVSGTLSNVRWINPHIYLMVDVVQPDNKVVTYSLENHAPAFYRAIGMTKADFKVGDKVVIEFYPARKTPHMGFAKVIKLGDRPPLVTMNQDNGHLTGR